MTYPKRSPDLQGGSESIRKYSCVPLGLLSSNLFSGARVTYDDLGKSPWQGETLHVCSDGKKNAARQIGLRLRDRHPLGEGHSLASHPETGTQLWPPCSFARGHQGYQEVESQDCDGLLSSFVPGGPHRARIYPAAEVGSVTDPFFLPVQQERECLFGILKSWKEAEESEVNELVSWTVRSRGFHGQGSTARVAIVWLYIFTEANQRNETQFRFLLVIGWGWKGPMDALDL